MLTCSSSKSLHYPSLSQKVNQARNWMSKFQIRETSLWIPSQKYFKIFQKGSCSYFCGTLSRGGHFLQLFLQQLHTFTCCMWGENTIATGENKCATKHEGHFGEEKKCFLGNNTYQGMVGKLLLYEQWSEGKKIRKKGWLVIDPYLINLCQMVIQIIALGTYR